MYNKYKERYNDMLNSFGVCCVLAAIISTNFDIEYRDTVKE